MSFWYKPQNYGRFGLAAFAAFCLIIGRGLGQEAPRETYRITFVDKGPDPFVPGSALYESTLATYHSKAIERRVRMGMSPVLDQLDKPIYQEYLSGVENLGLKYYAPCNWRNCVLIDLLPAEAEALSQLQMVETIIPTRKISYKTNAMPTDCGTADPGQSQDVHDLLNTLPLLQSGVGGYGSIICLIDEGFIYENMSSLAHADVLGKYDVLHNDANVGIEPEDSVSQGGHGSIVFSVVAGWEQRRLIGTAPFASYLLSRSEDMSFEHRSEEDNLCSAIEWAERNGADVVSLSLGYYSFNEDQDTTQYAWLNGHTTFAAQTINLSAMRGVMNVIATGNEGPADSTLNIPSDADSAIAVGASIRSRTNWPFSSIGPTADGRVKPDIAALGANVSCQTAEGKFILVSGTSMSTPQISGCLALLKQLYNQADPWVLRDAMYASATVPPEAKDKLGRGMPDMVQAARIASRTYGPGIGEPAIVNPSVGPLIFASVFTEDTVFVSLKLKENGSTYGGGDYDSLLYFIPLAPSVFQSDTVHGRLVVYTPRSRTNTYYPSDSTWFTIPRYGSKIPCGFKLPSEIVSVNDSQIDSPLSPRHSPFGSPLTTHHSPLISPNPNSTNEAAIIGAPPNIQTVRIIQSSTGAIANVEWHYTADDQVQLDVSQLTAGHYTVVVISAYSTTTLSLVKL